MKIQLDTKEKTIKVEENVLLKELFMALDKFLPNREWESFTLQTNVIINNWSNPIYITNPRIYPQPCTYPWYIYTTSSASCGTASGINSDTTTFDPTVPHTLTAGVYNIEV